MVSNHNVNQINFSIHTVRKKDIRKKKRKPQTGISFLDFAKIGLTRELKPRKKFKRQMRIMTSETKAHN
jgi:hypothetical protein